MPDFRFSAILEAAARLQEILPDAVLVGGSAAARPARPSVSLEDDHVLTDLRERFHEVLRAPEATGRMGDRADPEAGSSGSLAGIETAVRQLSRRRPLEVEEIEVKGTVVRVPTLAETLRIKAWLVLRRNATRDYLDLVALAGRLGSDEAARLMLAMDEYYEDQVGAVGRRVATQLVKQLAEPRPYDLGEVALGHDSDVVRNWQDWSAVVEATRGLAARVLELVATEA